MNELLQAIGFVVLVMGTVATIMAAFMGAACSFKNEKNIGLHADRLRALERSKGDDE